LNLVFIISSLKSLANYKYRYRLISNIITFKTSYNIGIPLYHPNLLSCSYCSYGSEHTWWITLPHHINRSFSLYMYTIFYFTGGFFGGTSVTPALPLHHRCASLGKNIENIPRLAICNTTSSWSQGNRRTLSTCTTN